MSQRPVPPRGMRDLLPAEVRLRRYLLERIVGAFEAYGFEQIEAPLLENIDRLMQSEGGDNQKLMYKVLRRGIDWQKEAPASEDEAVDLGLRYDLTVPLARYYATNAAQLPSPFKAIQIGPAFRAERPQKGRYRQFTQCDVDVLGEQPVTITHAELLLATVDALRACGLDSFVVRMNDRALLDALLDECGLAVQDRPVALIALDKLDKIGQEAVKAELEAIDARAGAELALRVEQLRKVTDVHEVAASFPRLAPAVAELAQLKALVGQDVAVRFDVTLVRGQGYYTGPIFELEHPDASGSIAAGGRYDRMVERLSGVQAPAAGMSIGFERICDLLAGIEVPDEAARVALVYERSASVGEVNETAKRLRASGKHVRTEPAVSNSSAQHKRLTAAGYTVQEMQQETGQ